MLDRRRRDDDAEDRRAPSHRRGDPDHRRGTDHHRRGNSPRGRSRSEERGDRGGRRRRRRSRSVEGTPRDSKRRRADDGDPPQRDDEPEVPFAVQKQVDQLLARMDAVATACDYYGAVGAVEEAWGVEAIPRTLRRSLYHTTVMKATQIFCAALIDRTLFFLLKYLTAHKVMEIDVITFRFLERLRGASLSERSTQLLTRVHGGRANKHTASLFGATVDKAEEDAIREGQRALTAFESGTLALPSAGSRRSTLPEEVDAYLAAITGRPDLSLQMAKERVKRSQSLAGTLIQQAVLRDPSTNEPLEYPCVGLECRHVQTFELRPFLAAALAQRRRGKRAAWRCPVCHRILPETAVVHCHLTAEIAAQLPADHEGYEVYYDASWAPVRKLPPQPKPTAAPPTEDTPATAGPPAASNGPPATVEDLVDHDGPEPVQIDEERAEADGGQRPPQGGDGDPLPEETPAADPDPKEGATDSNETPAVATPAAPEGEAAAEVPALAPQPAGPPPAVVVVDVDED